MGCSGRRVDAGQAILKREGKIEKGRLTYFPQDSKTIVTDHQQQFARWLLIRVRQI